MGYPCALGMATPLALIRGGGMAAEHGILIRSGEAFQVLKDITHVVLDKTGTITEGKPRLISVEPLNGYERSGVLAFAASAEAPSEHPLARAVTEAAYEEGLDVMGVEARVSGRRVVVGTARFLASRGVETSIADRQLAEHEGQAHTAFLLAVDGEVAGFLAIADTVKRDARKAVAEMKAQGILPVMLTGDNRRTAEAVAQQVGIEEVHAEVLPQDKADRVRAIQKRGGTRVLMAGDGINDAPALMQADVGVAIGAGTDIAIESSDVIVMGDRVGAIMEARAIGGLSYRKTVQNLLLAFFFNGIGVPLAATGLVHPAWAMIAMAVSVSAVLINSFGGRLLAFGEQALPGPSETPERPTAPPNLSSALDEILLTVPGISCRGCADTIEAYLNGEEGIEEVEVSAAAKTVRLVYHPDVVSADHIKSALARIGYGDAG